MKKFYLFIVSVFVILVLVACGGGTEQSSSGTTDNQNDSEETAEETNTKLGIGDTAEVGGIKFTLVNVTTTDERNEFADTNPPIVVKVEYEIENGTESEIPIGMDLEVYDGTGSKMKSYPLDNTMGSLQPGKKIQGQEHFGVGQGPIEIYFQPALSFDDPAIFEVDIQ